ncbi:1-(5-phosphoribosyl)-5-[(5-phosphoribosylamino)methylideneamino] imidazole-4-carboxamide isomerase [Rhodobacterales bacterium HKCCE3408]|nr:1-(5-phosphoribosyl)-5-[(5-phosphoribosylamino)methylideneamino] imidazole-4-carboxamide isomerase [Rhodobacterales bacterium HKCCE3408]
MMIYPTIELQNGRCVSLHRGRLEEPQIWHVDPVAKAREFAQAGAEWIHVTDLDGVASPGNGHRQLLIDIIHKANAPIQLGGGFRSYDTIAEWIDLGAGRIVVGTLAATSPHIVKKAAKRFPDQICLAVDVHKGRLMLEGWRSPSAIDPADFIRAFGEDPLAAIIITDIDAQVEPTDAELGLVTRLAGHATAPVIARGLGRSLDDLARLKYVPDIAGAIVGRALFDKSINLDDALALGAAARGPTAEFV